MPKITITKTVEETVEIPVPLFTKSGSMLTAVLSEKDMRTVLITDKFVSIQLGGNNTRLQYVLGETKITEEEFFTEYNKALELLSLKPELINK